jgi:hypothetical protein
MQTAQATSIPLSTKLVSSEHGFDDFDVTGHPRAHRMTVGHGTKNGDICNVYCNDGAKHGVQWRGSVKSSLQNFN